MDFQKLVDSFSEMDRKTRSQYHLTLEQLIARIESTPVALDFPVFVDHEYVRTNDEGEPVLTQLSVREPHSYRGFYSDLAFSPSPEICTARGLLRMARDSLGKTFEGYKGGDFRMGEKTPLWVASYGTTGRALMDLVFNGSPDKGHWTLLTKDVHTW